jgi:hypothetical protein
MRSYTILLALAFAVCTSAAMAQNPAAAQAANVGAHQVANVPHWSHVAPYAPYWQRYDFGGGLRYQRHASTAAEGYLRGSADLLRGQGQYNLLTAEARRAHAAAYAHEVANHDQAVQTYFSLRDYNREKRQAERGPRVTDDQLQRMAASGKPAPASPTDVDWISGEISWPAELQGPEYAEFRSDLQDASAEKVATGTVSAQAAASAGEAAEGMLEELKSHVRDISPQQYMSARRFIESLGHELQ